MAPLLQALQDYGWVAVLFVVLILNGGKIANFLAEKIAPAWAERRKQQLELQRQEIARREKEQLDIILVLKDMILSYKQELDDAKLERKQLHNVILDLVGKYEKLAAQIVEVLRDVSETLRVQSERLNGLTRTVNGRQQHSRTEGHGRETPGSGGVDSKGK